jgi:hypothetical protein
LFLGQTLVTADPQTISHYFVRVFQSPADSEIPAFHVRLSCEISREDQPRVDAFLLEVFLEERPLTFFFESDGEPKRRSPLSKCWANGFIEVAKAFEQVLKVLASSFNESR